MKSIFNFGNNEDEKIVTDTLKIGENVLIYGESFIPLSNISHVTSANEMKKQYPAFLWALIVIGIVLFFTKNVMGFLCGVVLIIVGVAFIYQIYKQNSERGYYLVISLNSGRNIFLLIKTKEFLDKIKDVIINCINNRTQSYTSFELKNCSIVESQLGDTNTVIKG